MTIKDGHEPKYIFKEDNNGKRGVVLTFVGEHQKKGKWKSKYTLEALSSVMFNSFNLISPSIDTRQLKVDGR